MMSFCSASERGDVKSEEKMPPEKDVALKAVSGMDWRGYRAAFATYEKRIITIIAHVGVRNDRRNSGVTLRQKEKRRMR